MEGGTTLWLLGLFLVLGFVAHYVGRRAHVPRVTLLLLIGVAVGPSALDLVPASVADWFPLVSRITLSMIGFMLGRHFKWGELKQSGRGVLVLSVVEAVGAAVAVGAALFVAGAGLALSLVFAAVAPATAPAATVDVIREVSAKGPVSETTLRVVAIDDAWGVLLFSALVVIVQSTLGVEGEAWGYLLEGAREVFGGVVLGLLLGAPMAWLSGRVVDGELTMIETLGAVLIAAGLAEQLGLSHLIACMTMGAVVANWGEHDRAFHAIEGASEPFLIVFFLLAGYALELGSLREVSWFGLLYVAARAAGKLGGARLGARLGGLSAPERRYVGWCLLPQAGVALGLGLSLAEHLPELGPRVLSTLVATTIAFELTGPIAARLALKRAGEAA